MTSPDWLDEIAERLEAATPGPWLHLEGEPLQAITPGFDAEGRLVFISGHGWADDAELIAHAPEDIARLVSEVKWLREVEATLQAVEREVAEVYVILTGGRVSKANTLSSVVVGEAEAYNERTCVADAWDEGYEAGDEYGYSNACAARYGDSPDDPPPANPYRTETHGGRCPDHPWNRVCELHPLLPSTDSEASNE